jgi:hypothetical protein|tara:strand:- start:150 stop:563 length:414 start_codon:yes stop_codon:yes gene_type:complete
MAAGNYSFTIEQGATTDFELVYKDSSGNPIDLTKYKARMQLKDSIGGSSTYLTLSSSLQADGTGLNLSGSGGNNASKPPTSGSIGVYISHATSSNFTFDKAVYDLELISGSGNTAVVTRLLQGKINLSKEVTTGDSY